MVGSILAPSGGSCNMHDPKSFLPPDGARIFLFLFFRPEADPPWAENLLRQVGGEQMVFYF